MHFRQFLEAGAATPNQQTPAFWRNTMPNAAAELSPQPSYGTGAVQQYQAVQQWKMQCYQYVIHLSQALRTIKLPNNKEYLPVDEFRRIHIEAINFLTQQKIISGKAEPLDGYQLNTNELNNIYMSQQTEKDIRKSAEQYNTKLSSSQKKIIIKLRAKTPNGQQMAEAIQLMINNRLVISTTNIYNIHNTTQKYQIVEELIQKYALEYLQQNKQQTQQNTQIDPKQIYAAGLAELIQQGVLTKEEISVYEMFPQTAIGQINSKYYRQQALTGLQGFVQPAVAASLQGRLPLSQAVQQTF